MGNKKVLGLMRNFYFALNKKDSAVLEAIESIKSNLGLFTKGELQQLITYCENYYDSHGDLGKHFLAIYDFIDVVEEKIHEHK